MADSEKANDPKYRKCVGVVIANNDGKVFIAERVEPKDAWQMPQGGVDEGEDLLEAARRELEEETSISRKDVELIAIYPDWLHYDFPEGDRPDMEIKPYDGQVQKWFCFRMKADDSVVNIKDVKEQEFTNWRWAEIDETIDLIVDFKRDIYKTVLKKFEYVIKNSNEA